MRNFTPSATILRGIKRDFDDFENKKLEKKWQTVNPPCVGPGEA